MVDEERQLNFEMDHTKEAFYTNDFAITVHPHKEILIDFRQTLPRTDVLPNGNVVNSVAVKHNPIVMQPTLLKMVVMLLNEELAKLEKTVGEIKLPDKWRMKKEEEKTVTTGLEKLSYIG